MLGKQIYFCIQLSEIINSINSNLDILVYYIFRPNIKQVELKIIKSLCVDKLRKALDI